MATNHARYARYDVPMPHRAADVNYQISRLFDEKRENDLKKLRDENRRLRWMLAVKESEEN